MSPSSPPPFVVALTGASGSILGVRLVEVLLDAGREVHLVVSRAGRTVMGRELAQGEFDQRLGRGESGRLVRRDVDDLEASIASGSFPTAGMVVCPCSAGTLSAIVHGSSRNLIHRAAEVHLKERRPLILVPRETPLSIIQLENLLRAAQAGAVVLPAAPGFYHRPKTIDDLVDFIVARVLDQLDVPNSLVERWGEHAPGENA